MNHRRVPQNSLPVPENIASVFIVGVALALALGPAGIVVGIAWGSAGTVAGRGRSEVSGTGREA
jgi:hypothetical protein